MKKTTLLNQSPLFLIFVAIYPSLALLSANIREVKVAVVTRPIFVSLILMGFLFLTTRLFFRNWNKSAIIASIAYIYFFSYGHFFNYLTSQSVRKPNRILLTLGIVLFLLALWVFRHFRITASTLFNLNILSIIFVVIPLTSILFFHFSKRIDVNEVSGLPTSSVSQKPDIYYIVLDAYTREDTLNKLGFDNSPFLEELRELGFYVASCSTSNYGGTANSMAATLNMNYLWEVVPRKNANDTGTAALYASIKNSAIQQYLQSLGYHTVAFETGYHWLNLDDANIFLSPDINYFWAETLLPFEDIFIKTTLLKPFIERGLIDITIEDTTFSQYKIHYRTAHFALDALPSLAKNEAPTFTYFHLIVPHPPFIFLPDGTFNPDANYYNDGGVGYGATQAYSIEGYFNNIQFVNASITKIIRKILAESDTPPIIIIQGDHGMRFIDKDRYNIINAYYLPGLGDSVLYSSITPVNSFRIVLNEYLGGDFEILDDLIIFADIGYPFRKHIVSPGPCP